MCMEGCTAEEEQALGWTPRPAARPCRGIQHREQVQGTVHMGVMMVARKGAWGFCSLLLKWRSSLCVWTARCTHGWPWLACTYSIARDVYGGMVVDSWGCGVCPLGTPYWWLTWHVHPSQVFPGLQPMSVHAESSAVAWPCVRALLDSSSW